MNRILGTAFQQAYVVRDLEPLMRRFIDTFNVGPFIHIQGSPPLDFFYRGQRTAPKFTVAYTYIGEVQVEIIQPLNDAPSPYRDFLASRSKGGIQHMGFWPDDVPAAHRHLEAQGLKRCFEIKMASGDVVYYDPPDGMGTMIEIAAKGPARAQLYAELHRLANTWDGRDPIRRYTTMGDFAKASGITPMW